MAQRNYSDARPIPRIEIGTTSKKPAGPWQVRDLDNFKKQVLFNSR